ncbi:MAG: hypothetical protein R2826_10635 [Thermoleophilia bacterium]
MKILRIAGYVVAFVVILLVVSQVLKYGLSAIGVTWPEMLQRAATVIATWAIFWFAIWRPMGKRAAQSQQQTNRRRS